MNHYVPQAKLTFKSARPEKSSVDLEALVNILTSDVQDDDCLDNMAVMYISPDGVNPDDPSSSASVSNLRNLSMLHLFHSFIAVYVVIKK